MIYHSRSCYAHTHDPPYRQYIIDILAQDLQGGFFFFSRNRALAACALTSRSWSPRSRLHLYSSAHVTTRQIKRFIESLTLNPSSGHLVRHLELCGNQEPAYQNELILVPVELPHKIPNVVHISFSWVNLAVLHSSFFTYFHRFYTVRYITCYDMISSSLHRTAQLVQCFPRLERFLTGSWCGEFGLPLSPTALTMSRIYHKVRVPHLFYHYELGQEHVLGLFSPSTIVSLSINYWVQGGEGHGYDSVLLRECRNTLRHLVLTLKGLKDILDALYCTDVPCTC